MKNIFGNALVFGDARVSGNAQVSDYARVSDYANVSGNAQVSGNADILVIGPAKSSGRYTTAHRDSVIGIRVNCGCFSGTIEEFAFAIEETHKNNPAHLSQYRAFVALIKANFNL